MVETHVFVCLLIWGFLTYSQSLTTMWILANTSQTIEEASKLDQSSCATLKMVGTSYVYIC
jgi:hypothetical protein